LIKPSKKQRNATIPNSHNLHSTTTEKKTGLKEEPIRIWRLKTITTISNIHNGYYPKEATPKFPAAKSPPTLHTTL
jgi:hypothetical protein